MILYNEIAGGSGTQDTCMASERSKYDELYAKTVAELASYLPTSDPQIPYCGQEFSKDDASATDDHIYEPSTTNRWLHKKIFSDGNGFPSSPTVPWAASWRCHSWMDAVWMDQKAALAAALNPSTLQNLLAVDDVVSLAGQQAMVQRYQCLKEKRVEIQAPVACTEDDPSWAGVTDRAKQKDQDGMTEWQEDQLPSASDAGFSCDSGVNVNGQESWIEHTNTPADREELSCDTPSKTEGGPPSGFFTQIGGSSSADFMKLQSAEPCKFRECSSWAEQNNPPTTEKHEMPRTRIAFWNGVTRRCLECDHWKHSADTMVKPIREWSTIAWRRGTGTDGCSGDCTEKCIKKDFSETTCMGWIDTCRQDKKCRRTWYHCPDDPNGQQWTDPNGGGTRTVKVCRDHHGDPMRCTWCITKCNNTRTFPQWSQSCSCHSSNNPGTGGCQIDEYGYLTFGGKQSFKGPWQKQYYPLRASDGTCSNTLGCGPNIDIACPDWQTIGTVCAEEYEGTEFCMDGVASQEVLLQKNRTAGTDDDLLSLLATATKQRVNVRERVGWDCG